MRGEPLHTATYYGPPHPGEEEFARLGYACSFIKSTGARISLPLTWCQNEAGESKWHWMQFPSKRPLYNWHLLEQQDAAGFGPVAVILFDEWCADIARPAVPSMVPVSWPGGIRSIDDVDWSPLRRALSVLILPHHGGELGEDGATPKPRERQPYVRAALKIADILKGYGQHAVLVMDTGEPSLHPDGWCLWDLHRESRTPAQIYDTVSALLASAPLADELKTRLKGGPAGQPPFGHSGGPGDGGSDDPDDRRPEIKIIAGKMPEVVDQAESALLKSGREMFQRAGAGMLVRVVRRDAPTVRNYKRPPGVGMLMVEPPYLVETFNRVARWKKYDSRKDAWKACDTPESIAKHYLARAGEWKLPVLRATITTPTLRPDGTVLQDRGYDAETKLYFDPCGVKYPRIPNSPSRENAERALELLKASIRSFPFVSDVDQAVALAALLTGPVRRSFGSAPAFGINAHQPRMGKSKLAWCIQSLCTGGDPPTMALPPTDEEAEKAAFSVLLDDVPAVLIDNVTRPIDDDWLCICLTSEVKSQRMLGMNKIVAAPTTVLWLITGNKLTFAGDMPARSLLCTIDARVENPESRVFEGPRIEERFLARRPELVVAALTVMRGFIASKVRAADLITPWGGFEEWSNLVRASLVWLGCEDPLESSRAVAAAAPSKRAHISMLEAWWTVFENRPATARQAIERIQKLRGEAGSSWAPTPSEAETLLDELLSEVGTSGKTGKLESKVLGRWIEKHANSPVRIPRPDPVADGEHPVSKPIAPDLAGKTVQFVAKGHRAGSSLWMVEEVNPQ